MRFLSRRLTLIAAISFVLVLALSLGFAARGPAASDDLERLIGESLLREALHSAKIGAQWLEAHQQEAGHWSHPDYPAVSGLALTALMRSPGSEKSPNLSPVSKKAVEYILSKVQKDGGIYQHIPDKKGGGLPNYNTSICMVALWETEDPDLEEVIKAARRFLIESQHKGVDVYHGGMGYDASTNRAYADMSNTFHGMEALNRTRVAELDDPAALFDWESAIGFVTRCQHLEATNDADWVREYPAEKGGFIYHPKQTKADAALDDDGKTTYPLAYGSITNAGLRSYMNARVKRTDPRAEAAYKWICKHWTLEENPRLGEQSLYFYYMTLALALDAYGEEYVVTPEGKRILWRKELLKKIIALQKVESETGLGYWQNETNRWWEGDPNLVTSYMLIALDAVLPDNL
ncbi:MAG: cycloartenol synthase [Candidatus Sumerlaeia bacterium]